MAKKIKKIDQQYITDELLKLAHEAELRGNSLASDMLEALTASRSDLISQIAKVESDIVIKPYQFLSQAKKIKFLELLKQEIDKVLTDVFATHNLLVTEALKDTLTATTIKTAGIYKAAMAITVSPPIINSEIFTAWVKTAEIKGLLINETLDSFDDFTKKKVLSVTRQCLIQGLPSDVLARKLQKEGIDGCKNALQGMARTLIQTAKNEGHLIIDKAVNDKYPNLIKGYVYSSTLDNRTCLVCGADDGKRFTFDELKPNVPRHYNCHCCYIPLTNIDKEIKNRPSVLHEKGSKAKVKKTNETYQQWITRMVNEQPEWAEKILGKKRFELLKSGKLTLQKMVVDGKLKSMT